MTGINLKWHYLLLRNIYTVLIQQALQALAAKFCFLNPVNFGV